MPTVTLANGTVFDAAPGQSILEAARSQGLNLAYSCGTGRCSTCQAGRVRGDARPLRPPTGLTADEQARGRILTCAYEAVTDLVLDIADLQVEGLVKPTLHPARINRIDRLAEDVVKVELRLPPRGPLRFLAGQHVEVLHPSGIRRSYSVASGADAGQTIDLHIRQVEGGLLSRYWFTQAAPDDLLRLYGPQGTFLLRPPAGRDVVFLATGTGIAPILSMLKQLASDWARQRPRSVRLYWGGRKATDLYVDPMVFLPELQYNPVLSKATPERHHRRGYVQDVLLSDLDAGRNGALNSADVYACGSPQMIAAAAAQLVEAGLPAASFFSDAFVSST